MSSFLCFICHSTVNEEINEETREKYRDVVGMNVCYFFYVLYSIWNVECFKFLTKFSRLRFVSQKQKDNETIFLCKNDWWFFIANNLCNK